MDKEIGNKLFHVSGWDRLKSVTVGDVIELVPGTQGAEGKGVYFSENCPRVSAAEGAQKGVTGIIVIDHPVSAKGWYRTKNSVCRKYGRARTWHSKGKSVRIEVGRVSGIFIFGILKKRR